MSLDREEVRKALENLNKHGVWTSLSDSLRLVLGTARAFVDGRLIDRQTLDYEAAKQALNEDDKWLVSPLIIECDPDHLVRIVVNAALGVPGE